MSDDISSLFEDDIW